MGWIFCNSVTFLSNIFMQRNDEYWTVILRLEYTILCKLLVNFFRIILRNNFLEERNYYKQFKIRKV